MHRFLPFAALLVACGPAEDTNGGFTTSTGATGEGSCVEVDSRALTVDEDVGDPLFMSAQNVLDELTGVTNTTNVLTWPDELTTSLEIEFFYTDGDVRYVERDNDGVLAPEDMAWCFITIEIDGEVTFASGDGAFDETFPATLQAKGRREGLFRAEVDMGSLGGTWTPADSGIDSTADLTLEWLGDITNLGSEGEIVAHDGDTEYPVATWNPPPTQGR